MRYFKNFAKLARLFALPLALVLALGSWACSTDDKEEESPSTLGESNESGSPLQIASNLEKVYEKMLPASLAIEQGGAELTQGNPCAEATDFFDCQPNLLKLWLHMGRFMVGNSKNLVETLAPLIERLPIESTGILELGGGDGPTAIHYSISSASDYIISMHTAEGPFLYLAVSEEDGQDSYDLRFDSANSPNGDGGGNGPSRSQVSIKLSSEDEFSISIGMHGDNCNADDVKAPQNFVIYIEHQDGSWQGKANIYSPRWLDPNPGNEVMTCDDAPTDSSKLFLYHDFAGDNDATTASLYMASTELTKKADIGDWGIESACDNFPICLGGTLPPANAVVAETYINPFCVTAEETTWNGACENIPVSKYTPNSLWWLPSELEDLSVSLPETLD